MTGGPWRHAVLAAALAAGAACPAGVERGSGEHGIRVAQVIVVAPAPGAPAALYARITNRSSIADSLVGLSTPEADSVRLHDQVTHGAVMRMRLVPSVVLPAGADVRLAPGGLHGMLFSSRPALTVGDTIPITFHFGHSEQTVAARVVSYAGLERALAVPPQGAP